MLFIGMYLHQHTASLIAPHFRSTYDLSLPKGTEGFNFLR